MEIGSFLEWYLRINEQPEVRVARADRYLRKARDLMRGFRFVRQDPWECTVSYILSVQAHMALTKQRIHFIANILGDEVRLRGERYWTFPSVNKLALIDEGYFRHQRFGWRSKFLPISIDHINDSVGEQVHSAPTLEEWQAIIDGLRAISNTGVGLKVAKCIDLFSLDRLGAVPVDTWVRKCAEDWYGIEGSDARICNWAEERGGKLAGYWNEYLFAYYRELNAAGLDDRVLSFAASDEPSSVLPFERIKDNEID
jgi:N-glycosylase/DNA lyase